MSITKTSKNYDNVKLIVQEVFKNRNYQQLMILSGIIALAEVIIGYYFTSRYAFNIKAVNDLITIFTITNSLLSLIVPITLDRKALRPKLKKIMLSLFALWFSVILSLIIIVIAPEKGNPNAQLIQIAIGVWIAGISYLLILVYEILTLDSIRVVRFDNQFSMENQYRWGMPAIDEQLKELNKKPVYFPIIILAEESTGPWFVLQRFILSGLSHNLKKTEQYAEPNKYDKPGGGIYITFTRPAHHIVRMLVGDVSDENVIYKKYGVLGDMISDDEVFSDKKVYPGICDLVKNFKSKIQKEIDSKYKSPLADKLTPSESADLKSFQGMMLENLVLIDCFSRGTEQSVVREEIKKIKPDLKVFFVDLIDPHMLNVAYVKSLCYLKDRCMSVRVVYDGISDYFKFTDFQLATQYLRHNMVDGECAHIQSLNTFRTGVIDEKDEKYFLWFSNGTIKMTLPEIKSAMGRKYRDVEFSGSFNKPKKFKMDSKFKSLPNPLYK